MHLRCFAPKKLFVGVYFTVMGAGTESAAPLPLLASTTSPFTLPGHWWAKRPSSLSEPPYLGERALCSSLAWLCSSLMYAFLTRFRLACRFNLNWSLASSSYCLRMRSCSFCRGLRAPTAIPVTAEGGKTPLTAAGDFGAARGAPSGRVDAGAWFA